VVVSVGMWLSCCRWSRRSDLWQLACPCVGAYRLISWVLGLAVGLLSAGVPGSPSRSSARELQYLETRSTACE
jgi:hypothetical protein